MSEMMYSVIKASYSFEKFLVPAIFRRSLTLSGGNFLGTGVTCSCFQMSGQVHELKILLSGVANSAEYSLIILQGMFPQIDDYFFFILQIFSCI